MNIVKKVLNFVLEALKRTFVYKGIVWFFNRPLVLSLTLVSLIFGYLLAKDKIDEYVEEFNRLNSETAQEEENKEEGLTFTQIDDNLWTLTGSVAAGDCEKVVRDMPDTFAVILESPGGNLAEGSCIASHLKIRNVVTVIRGTPVINDEGKEIYTPGKIAGELGQKDMEGKTMCASACSLFFLAGDKRYLIGDVLLGIHGPSTPPEFIGRMNPQQLEVSAYRTAANLMQLLERLEVHESLRLLFIQIPGYTMYWVNPRDFEAKPELITFATNYRNFWGFSAANPDAVY